MKEWIPLLLAFSAGLTVMLLYDGAFESDIEQTISKRVPYEKQQRSVEELAQAMAFMNGEFKKGSAFALAGPQPESPRSDLRLQWREFRGNDRDGIAQEAKGLIRAFPDTGPIVQWQRKLAKGHASVVVNNGKMYMVDYESATLSDVVRCMSFETGEDIWTYRYPVKTKTNHGITRCMPAVNDRYLIAFGPKCHVICLDSETGERKWAKSLVEEYGTKVPNWYAGQNPIIEGDTVIIAPSGPEVMMVAFDLETGAERWRTPNPEKWKMTHCSIGVMTIAGTKMYVYTGSAGVAGIDASNGKILWINKEWKISIAAIATPIYVGEGKIFLSAGYGVGSMMLEIRKEGDIFTAKSLFRLKEKAFGSAQHTPVFYKGAIYGVRPSEEAVSMKLDGSLHWTSTMENKFGIGPYMIADDMLFIMDDHGRLTLAEATTAGFKILSQTQAIPDAHDSWGPMVLVDGRLIVRDLQQMLCLDMRAISYE